MSACICHNISKLDTIVPAAAEARLHICAEAAGEGAVRPVGAAAHRLPVPPVSAGGVRAATRVW